MKTIFILFAVCCLNFVAISQDSKVCSMSQKVLERLQINVQNVRIADGTAKGGSRVMIVTYIVNYDSSKHAGELTKVLEIGYAANQNMKARLHEVSAIASNSIGSPLAIINTKILNTETVLLTRDTKRYIESWNVIRYDKNFLPTVLSKSKQIKQ